MSKTPNPIPPSADNLWERFAQEDAEFYICTELPRSEFFQSGEAIVARLLDEFGTLIPERNAALEIGCGVGRLTLPLAKRFARITAVDISPTMLGKLAANCEQAGVKNVKGYLPHQDWVADNWKDLALSLIVFQHISDFHVIVDYINNIARSLKPGGVAILQFDTRSDTLTYRIRGALPDALLPRTQRRGIRRVRRSREALLQLFRSAGLNLVASQEPDTEYEVFVLKKDKDLPGAFPGEKQ